MTSWRTVGPPVTLIRALLRAAHQRGIHNVGPTKLCGLVYLLDLEMVRRYETPATDIDWIWRDFGPFHQSIAYGPREDSEIVELPAYGGTGYRLRHPESVDVTELDSRIASVLVVVMDEHGHRGAKAIKKHCYATEPMLAVQRTGSRGDRIDLGVARPVDDEPDPAILERLSRIRQFDRPHVTSTAHTRALLDVVEENRDLREAATNDLLN